MENYDYQSETVVNYLPNKANLDEELLLSADIKGRRYVELFPNSSSEVKGINSAAMNNVSVFKITSASEWLDLMNANLIFNVSNVQLPAGSKNVIVPDGRYAFIQRITCSINGVEVQSNIQDFNKHRNAKYLNEAFISNYTSDSLMLNPGNSKLSYILASGIPTGQNHYRYLGASSQNMIDNAASNSSGGCYDACGVNTYTASAKTNNFGYRYMGITDQTTQTFTIPLSELINLFAIEKYFPLLLCNDGILINIYWASPTTAFFSDLGTYTAGTAPAPGPVAPGTFQSSAITSYDVANIKIACDMLVMSDTLNNAYKSKALSDEGVNLVYDDFLVQTLSLPSGFSGTQRNFQAHLSTSSLKSILFYQQAKNLQNVQNAWCNSNFCYLGVNGFQIMLNNTLYPPKPLNTPTEICLWNNRSRGVISNQISQFVATNPWVFGNTECSVSAVGYDAAHGSATDYPVSATAFMIYSNFEKILNEGNILRNGVDLKSGNSTINIIWQENTDNSAGAVAVRSAALGQAPGINGNPAGSATGNGLYSAYVLSTYQRLFTIRNGTVEVIG